MSELEQLRAVAIAAKALVRSATSNALFSHEETVDEGKLADLETALAAAGYDLTDEEMTQRVANG